MIRYEIFQPSAHYTLISLSVLEWYLSEVKQCLGYAQIGVPSGFTSNFSMNIPALFTWEPPGLVPFIVVPLSLCFFYTTTKCYAILQIILPLEILLPAFSSPTTHRLSFPSYSSHPLFPISGTFYSVASHADILLACHSISPPQ